MLEKLLSRHEESAWNRCGPGAVGHKITIYSHNLGGEIVEFGTVAATSVGVDALGTHAAVTVPSDASAGSCPIVVTTVGGSMTASRSFMVTAPVGNSTDPEAAQLRFSPTCGKAVPPIERSADYGAARTGESAPDREVERFPGRTTWPDEGHCARAAGSRTTIVPSLSFPRPHRSQTPLRFEFTILQERYERADVSNRATLGSRSQTTGLAVSMRQRGGVCRSLDEALELTFPNELRFFTLVRLVLSGLAAQLDLPYERVDDLQLAVEGALAGKSPPGEKVTLRIEPRPEALSVSISPIEAVPASGAEDTNGAFGFDRIAAKLVDSVEVVSVDGTEWLRLEKRIPANPGSSS